MKNSKARPSVVKNPEWLLHDPEGAAPPPPVKTRGTDLPFSDLDWRDFERLCKQLAKCSGNVEHVWSYGTPGQAQYGIDILVRMADGTHEVWQTKRYKKMNPSTLQAAADLFLQHKWASKATKFVLAVACDLNTTGAVERINKIHDQLAKKKIAFECLDAENLSKQLISEPKIIDDFFGRPWVERVCPPESLKVVAARLSRFDLADLRQSLAKWFGAWISTVDPGLPIADLGRSGQSMASLPINERYIRPDVLVQLKNGTVSNLDQTNKKTNEYTGGSSLKETRNTPRNQSTAATFIAQQRVDLDQFLLDTEKSIIIGDAGMGKSTLLRIVALDILSKTPQLDAVQRKYSTYLPVWVPFSLWTRMATERASPPSLEDVVREFFLAQSEPQLAEALCTALATSKVLLLIDGLDEASDPVAARTVFSALSSFAESHNFPAIVTSRPHGIQVIGGSINAWTKAELAPLTDIQRNSLALLWFRVIVKLESDEDATKSWLEQQAERRTNSLDLALKRNSSIARLSQAPLILLTLMQLHRQGNELPRSKYAALERIIDQLVEHQPRRREVESLSTVSVDDMHKRQRDKLLYDFAFALHTGELRGPFSDAANEEDAVDRASSIVIQRQGNQDQDRAEAAARSVFQFAEERAGVLVKKAPQTIGFLHLSIQEFLVSRHISQFPFRDRVKFVHDNAENAHWREPILCLLYLEQNELQNGELVRAIEKGRASSGNGRKVRDSLLIEAIFSDFSHDMSVAREIALRLMDETELTGWGEQQHQMLTSTVDGLTSETVGELCYTRLKHWLPDRHGYGVPSAIYEMPNWPAKSHEECHSVLIRALNSDNASTRLAAAETLPLLTLNAKKNKDQLLSLLKASPSVNTVASTLNALCCGWANDPDIIEITNCAKRSQSPIVAMEGIRLRAKQNKTDLEDMDRFVGLNFNNRGFGGGMHERQLIEHFSTTHKTDFTNIIEEKLERAKLQNGDGLEALIGSLVLCDASHPKILPEISNFLGHNWNIRELFCDNDFPTEKVLWNDELEQQVRKFLDGEDAKFWDYELYWVSKVLPVEWLKKRIIRNLSVDGSFHFWSARALVETWGPEDSEVQESLLPFLEKNGADLASVAEFMPTITEDKQILRKAFLRAINDRPNHVGRIVHGLRLLGTSSSDKEAFDMCLEAGDHIRGGQFYVNPWREQMILTFHDHITVREMAYDEMRSRGGHIGAIAKCYASDHEMNSNLLNVIQPLPKPDRSILVQALNDAAIANDKAARILEFCQNDDDSAIALGGTTGWMKSLTARNAVTSAHIECLADALHTVGPDFPSRRLAALLALAIADRLDVFANATDHDGTPLQIGALGDHIARSGANLGQVLSIWPKIVASIKNEAEALERLEIGAETILGQLNPTQPNAERIFNILIEEAPSCHHLSEHDHVSSLAKFRPKSDYLRELVLSLLTQPHQHYWGSLVAGEIFAEQFSQDTELRRIVMETFKQNPDTLAAAALAELVLHHGDSEIEDLLRKNAGGIDYDIATQCKLTAALSQPDDVLGLLKNILDTVPNEVFSLQLSRWVPAMIRRFKQDSQIRDLIQTTLSTKSSSSEKVSFISMLVESSHTDEKLKGFIKAELENSDLLNIPDIGFDLLSQEYRLVRHVLVEAL